MASSSTHPDELLFDYLRGSLDRGTALAVEAHLAGCADCATVAGFVRDLKSQIAKLSEISDFKFEITGPHPDVSELANFFYSKTPGERSPEIAAHVAVCQSCATEVAEYARAERAAADYVPAAEQEGVPAAAWEMIRDWEESCFAKPRPASETLDDELLTRLLRLLAEQKEKINYSVTGQPDRVPVIIVDRAGRFRGVEIFEEATDERGVRMLKSPDESRRFDNRQVHALLDFGESDCVIMTYRVQSSTIRLQRAARPDAHPRQAHYFIVEEDS
ncbi:MAG TPA: zf-HC2 domain-containing protein [Blastocatellia bacterium]|nr:zf-HC2 domain-containing protein [Blastocatellia bacterium]